MTRTYMRGLFDERPGRSVLFPRNRLSTTWLLRKCILRRVKGDKISLEVFQDPETHEWLLSMNECMETLTPEMMSQTARRWIPIFTAEDHTLHLKVKDARLFHDLPDIGSDVDAAFAVNCAWFNKKLIGVSMKIVSIHSHVDV